MRGVFVTGTDTDAGKTLISTALVKALGDRAMGLKPVASGSHWRDGYLINDDAKKLWEVSAGLSYEDVNVCSLEPAIAPHLAAQQVGMLLSVNDLVEHVRGVSERYQRFAVVEGAGGWRVPLNQKEYFSDLASALGLPVLLVVRVRLGCINHALLTAEAVERDGLTLSGWVANGFVPDSALDHEVMDSIRDRLAAPCVGRVPLLGSPDSARVAGSFESSWLSALTG